MSHLYGIRVSTLGSTFPHVMLSWILIISPHHQEHKFFLPKYIRTSYFFCLIGLFWSSVQFHWLARRLQSKLFILKLQAFQLMIVSKNNHDNHNVRLRALVWFSSFSFPPPPNKKVQTCICNVVLDDFLIFKS